MKKLLILPVLLLAAYFGWAQSPSINKPGSPPKPSELRLLSGAYGIVDSFHPSWNITVVTQAHTLNDTNSIVLIRCPTVDAINHITFPDCTNYIGRHFRIITAGPRNLAVLTNANSQSFESFTNTVTTAGYSVSSNQVVDVFSTGTNWYVLRVATGNN
jgi:hypothetical protein